MHFTVVIPAHGCERTIDDAVRSALVQSVEDLEVIVVDDGSTDATLARARAIEDARLRVLTQPNAGVMAARRRGFEAGNGDALVFLDGDDRLRPNALERYARLLAARPEVGVVYGDRVFMDSEGRLCGSEHGALLNPRPSGDVLRRILARNFLSTLGQACFRRECLTDSIAIGLNVRRAIDWVLYCEIAVSSAFAYVGRGPVVEYRLSADSMARSLASTGEHAADIADIAPAIHAIYSIPAVAARFSTSELARLRRATEASAYAWKGQELLRARRWREARACFFRALRRSRIDARDLLCLVLTYLRAFPPGAKRFIGVP